MALYRQQTAVLEYNSPPFSARAVPRGPNGWGSPAAQHPPRFDYLNSAVRKTPKVGFVSLGCPKALVDSERILTRLRAEGYEVAASYQAADLVVVNTCGFIDAAVDESLEAIGEALAQNGKVIVTGCLGAQPQKILDRHPQVLKITGPQRYEEVVASVHEHLPPQHEPFLDLIPAGGVKLTPRHYAYLKISEGCNHHCSFCIIPSMRGRLVSRPVGEVLREAEQLVRAGVKEILVISQDTSAYGADLKYARADLAGRERRAQFYDLAAALGELGAWIRLHYVYPYPHVDKVVELMADGRVLPYLDIPFQHASARILKLMKRPAAAEDTLERIAAWRRAVPDITLRSTFIVGFPRRDRAGFRRVAGLAARGAARSGRLLRVFAGSKARRRTGLQQEPVPAEVKQERRARFMELSAEISARTARAKGRPHHAGTDRQDRGRRGCIAALRAMRPRSTARCGSAPPAASKWVNSPTCGSSRPAPTISRRGCRARFLT